jgi:hypothetical protein
MNKTLSGTLAAAVAPAGTFVVSYPALTAPEFPGGVTDSGYFARTRLHTLVVAGAKYENPQGFSLTLGTANITVTNRSANTWPAGSPFVLELQEPGKNVYVDQGLSGTGNRVARMYRADTFRINLGAPDVADADGICASQGVTGGVDALINGALASGGAVIFDAPRNVVAAWTNASVITVRGFDEYGNAMTESSASGTSLAGKKAFKRITRVTFSATVTGATVGSGDVLGLPVYLPSTGWVLAQLQDGAAATAGTVVAGDVTAGGSTATTGDVRGTYDPNAAADGARVFELVVALMEPGDLGMPQFAG